jgi:glutamate-5-semialdehyde dehydrogenase
LEQVKAQIREANAAARLLATTGTQAKNAALRAMADALEQNTGVLIETNGLDVEAGKARELSPTLLDRLTLTDTRIKSMADGLREVASLPDPVGEVLSGSRRPNGLEIQRVRVPLGVIAVIYESRPNVTVDAAGLCLKAGNATILRGGSEAIHSNTLLAKLMREAGEANGLPAGCLQFIETTERSAALTLMQAEGEIDLLIPRGGERLKKSILENATVPVLTSLGGNCHVYVDESAPVEMAAAIAFNAKASRPSVCNAMETLLVHSKTACQFLPAFGAKLRQAGIEIRGCERTMELILEAQLATETDWETEFLAPIIAIRVVDSLDEAISHIGTYGTGHSEAIVTQDYHAAQRFVNEIDAACVYVNASTRFTDGAEFGMGAEVGISTQKLHARGPVGLAELTTYKTIVRGSGQIRQ